MSNNTKNKYDVMTTQPKCIAALTDANNNEFARRIAATNTKRITFWGITHLADESEETRFNYVTAAEEALILAMNDPKLDAFAQGFVASELQHMIKLDSINKHLNEENYKKVAGRFLNAFEEKQKSFSDAVYGRYYTNHIIEAIAEAPHFAATLSEDQLKKYGFLDVTKMMINNKIDFKKETVLSDFLENNDDTVKARYCTLFDDKLNEFKDSTREKDQVLCNTLTELKNRFTVAQA